MRGHAGGKQDINGVDNREKTDNSFNHISLLNTARFFYINVNNIGLTETSIRVKSITVIDSIL